MMNDFHMHITWVLEFVIWNLGFGIWVLALVPCI